MTISAELAAEHAAAHRELIDARAAYNRTWRRDPTPKGFPKVDRALNRLEKAEREAAALDAIVARS